jgi:tetrahydromethanopterin S-methyltransferase subunit B
MEGQMFMNEDVDMVQAALYGINKFILEEKPYFEHIEEFEKAVDDYLTEPTPADSTALGEVPQEPVKCSIRPGWIRGPYGMNIMYRT